MNIFQVLSQGKSRLNEPSMSAMLGYLLDSNKDHGLGDAFVRVFLSTIDEDVFKQLLASNFIKSQVELEKPYQLGKNRKDIDIEISLLSEDNKENYKIIIENKIKIGAANPKQLKDYYDAILQDDPQIKHLYIIFLTPQSTAIPLRAEYENLMVSNNHLKKWLFWESADEKSVLSMVRDVLNFEMIGEINPINEYMRHTLRAFIRHSSLVTLPKTNRIMRTGEDLGEIVEQVEISIDNGKNYNVIRRDSTQIQVFNIKTGDKEIARPILVQFMREQGIDVPQELPNTRIIGKLFFEGLRKNQIHE